MCHAPCAIFFLFHFYRILLDLSGKPLTIFFLLHHHRGGLPRGTDQRCLPETTRLCGVPNPGEGLPPRVSGQLCRGRRRTGHLLHPPTQQTQEIHLPVHWRILLCPGSGKGGQMWLYKMFIIRKKNNKKKKKDAIPLADSLCLHCVWCSCPPLLDPHPFVQSPKLSWESPCSAHSPPKNCFVKTLTKP